jgi:prepilin-type N-terminal cleavage/methylation domain-containing protein
MNKGFTLIEVLLYIAIVTVIMSAMILFAWNVIILGAKSNSQQELYAQARIVSERINSEIRNANDINTGTSNFDVNLVTSSSNQISLVADAPRNPIIFNVVSGIVMIKLDALAAVPLHSNSISVTNLIFTNYSSVDGKTKHIGYTLSLMRNTTSAAQQYKGTVTLEGSAEIRSNPL